ncbi:MAG TPA: DHA2 family efflux MFS transporter permease subunit [Caulobacteraceae bacterium]|jgi:DHA2 family multidrug resistance protein|nr:DHA2 family efflux MFS transporter permease subunit [Caulobacteraceae bacterium]
MSFASAMAARQAGPLNRPLITLSIMASTLMVVLDTTIANVALPHMQGSLNASQDQVTWVLTSYIVASAILTPLTGWLATRLGRKNLFLIAVAGFTVASALCGIATSIEEMVLFRLLQGVFGAPMLPLGQSVLLDINPREKHGQAMAIYGMGVMVGPIMGPVLGGWLTEAYSWRSCFYINVPVGLLAAAGVFLSVPGQKHDNPPKLDLMGFLFLSLALGALQMMLDRGQGEDWFQSPEIWIEGGLALLGFWWAAIQTATAADPFIKRALLRDRNFVTATVLGFFLGVMVFSTTALLPPLMQRLMGYSVLESGLALAPRGIGTLISMFFVGRLIGRVDARLILLGGFILSATGVWLLAGLSLQADSRLIVLSGVIQGIGLGSLFVPLSTIAFATMPQALRTDASALFTLVRNIGSGVGISIINAVQLNNISVVRGTLVEQVRPDNLLVRALPTAINPATPTGLAHLDGEITRQASMVAYVDAFYLTAILCVVCTPLLLLLRSPRRNADIDPAHTVME